MLSELKKIFIVKHVHVLYIVHGFWSNFKNSQKSNFDRNQRQLATQHKNKYMYQKNYKNKEFSPNYFWRNLTKDLFGLIVENFKIFKKNSKLAQNFSYSRCTCIFIEK